MVWTTTPAEFGAHVQQMVDFARKWALSISMTYHENDETWAFKTWSAAPTECLATKDRSSIEIAWKDLIEQWEKVLLKP